VEFVRKRHPSVSNRSKRARLIDFKMKAFILRDDPLLATRVKAALRLPEAFEKIKNYPANSVSKFSHYSSSIILLELLLEVVPVSSKFLRVTNIIPVPKGAVPDNRIVLVQRRTRKPRFLDANQPSLRARQ